MSSDIGTFLEQMLQENLIPFKYSDKTFPGSILWLQAKPNGMATVSGGDVEEMKMQQAVE